MKNTNMKRLKIVNILKVESVGHLHGRTRYLLLKDEIRYSHRAEMLVCSHCGCEIGSIRDLNINETRFALVGFDLIKKFKIDDQLGGLLQVKINGKWKPYPYGFINGVGLIL